MMQNTLENVQEFFLKANFVVLAGLCFFLFFFVYIWKNNVNKADRPSKQLARQIPNYF